MYFSKNTVRKASELYLKHGNQAKHTLEHEHQIHGLTVVESWIVENKEQDKSHLYDLDVPVGTWMVAVKVDNEAIWQEWVKEGKVKGFSIEGYFVDRMKKNSEDEMLAELAKAIVKTNKRTKSGTRVVMESFDDYPDAVKNNARRGIELNEKNGNKCATQTGKVRAQQLAKGEPKPRDREAHGILPSTRRGILQPERHERVRYYLLPLVGWEGRATVGGV